MNATAERLTQKISDATHPDILDAEEALEVMEEVASWLEGSIEALKGDIEEGMD